MIEKPHKRRHMEEPWSDLLKVKKPVLNIPLLDSCRYSRSLKLGLRPLNLLLFISAAQPLCRYLALDSENALIC